MILLQEHTKRLIDNTITGSVHGILLSGPPGAGKGHAARYVAHKKLGLETPEQLAVYPYFEAVLPENGSISIDQIRQLQRFLQLKTPGTAGIRRIVIIEDAHLMTAEAQNALLKSLEEPPADTLLILTAPATLRLKKTIYSRVQQIPILPLSKDQTTQHFEQDFPPTLVAKAHAISGGSIGLMHALLHAEDHALLAEVQRAKTLLSGTPFDRLASVDELSKQKDVLPLFLQACKLICSTALHQSAQKGQPKQVQRWHHALQAVYDTEAALPHNPNPKLLLSDLLLAV